jgi:hypothetical protein
MTAKMARLAVSWILTFVLCGAVQAQQKKIVAFGAASPERGSARVGFWDPNKNGGAGGFFIDYGRPAWKKDYEDAAKFDKMTKGVVWRLGSDYWTVLDTNVPLKISGTEIPAGIWYLGAHRSDDGAEWTLVFVDPARVRATKLDPSEINKAPVALRAPLKMEQAETAADRLTITLLVPKTNLKETMLRIAWGKLQLTAPIEISIGT